jgi:hypothetical protein
LGVARDLVQQQRTDGEGDGNVLRRQVALRGIRTGGIGLGGEPLAEVGAPGVEVVDPGLDGVDPGAELVDGEAGRPDVVGERQKRSLSCL